MSQQQNITSPRCVIKSNLSDNRNIVVLTLSICRNERVGDGVAKGSEESHQLGVAWRHRPDIHIPCFMTDVNWGGPNHSNQLTGWCFPVSVIKHQDKTYLRKGKFILAHGSRGLEATMAGMVGRRRHGGRGREQQDRISTMSRKQRADWK